MRFTRESDFSRRTTTAGSISSFPTRRTIGYRSMAVPRFYSRLPIGTDNAGRVIELDESAAHHATRVLRLAAGDALTLFDGSGGEFDATLERVDKRGAAVRVLRFVPIERESPLAVTLAQGIAANDAMDSALRKATELGVTSIQPLVTARSAPLPAGERADRRLAHWRQVAIAACEQCGRNRIPNVAPPQPFADWLRRRDIGDPIASALL